MLTRLWQKFIDHSWLVLILLVILQTVFSLDSRSLWYADEVRYGNVFVNMIQHGHWLVMNMNGHPYPDKPPMFFWLLALLHLFFKQPAVFFAGAAVSGILYLIVTQTYGRIMGFGREVSFAACLVLLTTFFFVALLHYLRMDLLFSVFILAAQACLFHAIVSDSQKPTLWFVAGFVLMAFAVLTKGPLGIAFPVLTTLLFVAWRNEWSRFKQPGMWLGVLLMLIILGAWLVLAARSVGWGYIDNIFGKQIFGRAVNAFHFKKPLNYYFWIFPLTMLPWLLIIIALPVQQLFKKSFWSHVWQQRRTDDVLAQGRTWCWISLTSGFILLSSLSGKNIIYTLPLFAPLALLIADALFRAKGVKPVRIFIAIGVVFLLGALSVTAVELSGKLPSSIHGLWYLVGAFLLYAIVALYFSKRAPHTPLLTLALSFVFAGAIVAPMLTPSLDSVLSPRSVGVAMRPYIAQGYTPVELAIYDGVFSYYAGSNMADVLGIIPLKEFMRSHPKMVVVMKLEYWQAIQKNKLVGYKKVYQGFVSGKNYVVALYNKPVSVIKRPQFYENNALAA